MSKQLLLSGFETLCASQIDSTHTNDIRDFPNLSRDTMTRNAKWFGLSGEFFVDSILLRFGIYTSQLPEVLPADRIVYHPRADLRMQIKTCCRARDGYFHFNLSRGYHRSPTGVKPYETNDFDLVALVALSENAVKFSADRQGSQRIAISEIETLRADPCASLEQAIDDLGFAGGKAPGSSLSPTLGGGGCR
ncbi:Hypothetical protein RAK1035_3293 [Roseovarius sp. AK1035]|jgi:hypothetical protein|uniref:Uncharacterized protein n=1 Tax=Roseovarius mucosus TaxID=215743 RepID=A0A1V0RJL3_9RHOB|nr:MULTISPECIES: hypothetical protein [Roseovarius]ARE81963.1 hypothetical protein ROSMUCSMR3_00459 [Roseovarius mucosus]AWZ22000.1 Hypothetical protein RAK1035_3293 [Roseovarius sp. AK1035]MBW4972283.1 hypothetical protein [Roseovarius mucosus]|tara:strand:- start:204 stop:779 length:576 start_codon:yes stop_codon:yes gene_type:complete